MQTNRLNVCDLNAIETRCAAWVCQSSSLLDVFKQKKDPYLDFAMKMTQIPYERLEQMLKSKDPREKAEAKNHRQVAKPGVLGCVYRLSGGDWGENKYGDAIKTGLWGYAENMGVIMPREHWHNTVKIFRNSYEDIPRFWYESEKAVKEVLQGTKAANATLGPEGCIKLDKINIKGRGPIFRIQLPSGRYLHYIDASVEDTKMPWKDEETGDDIFKPTFVYYGVNSTTKQWSQIASHGGKILENIVQGIARDVLAEALLRADEKGMNIVLHVHDEGASISTNDPFAPGLPEWLDCMSKPMPWAPTLPLGADGYEGLYYRKG